MKKNPHEIVLPPAFRQQIVNTFHKPGQDWLAQLPGTLEKFCQRWRLTLLPPFEQLSYNFVVPVRLEDGREAVLKLGIPNPELVSEIEALRIYAGHGVARLLEADAAEGALLIERLQPGQAVSMLDDEQSTCIAAQIMQQFCRPVPSKHNLRSVEQWALGITRLRKQHPNGNSSIPSHLIDKAESLFSELIASASPLVVLHGDLHHWNILSAQRQSWLAIDPKGVVGEPAFEIAAWMHNPMPWLLEHPSPRRVLARRLDQFREILQIDRQRLWGWSLAQTVLSACWCLEDKAGCSDEMIAVALLLDPLETQS